MLVKSTIWEDIATPFPLIFFSVAFCPIGWAIHDGMSVYDSSIDVSELDDDVYALEPKSFVLYE